jgi:hypothetical protein
MRRPSTCQIDNPLDRAGRPSEREVTDVEVSHADGSQRTNRARADLVCRNTLGELLHQRIGRDRQEVLECVERPLLCRTVIKNAE